MKSIDELIKSLSKSQQEKVNTIRTLLEDHLPKGFEQQFDGVFIHYVVPLSLYAKGYHVDSTKPLPFVSLGVNKQHVVIYHFGLYSDSSLLESFKKNYQDEHVGRLNMGKSCIRLKNEQKLPIKALSYLFSQMSAQQWISIYEASRDKK